MLLANRVAPKTIEKSSFWTKLIVNFSALICGEIAVHQFVKIGWTLDI